jgi:hypothetical protein
MPRIFISYRRQDSGGQAGRIYDRLSPRFGATNVFMDVDTLRPGVDFVRVLQDAVSSCDVLLAVIGRTWLTTADDDGKPRLENHEDFVRVEIAMALAIGIYVIPVLVGGASMPRSSELPADLVQLARRHAQLVPDTAFHAGVNKLIEAIEQAEDERKQALAEEEQRLAQEAAARRKAEEEQRQAQEAAARLKADEERRDAGDTAKMMNAVEPVQPIEIEGAELEIPPGRIVKLNLPEAYPETWVRPEAQYPDQREGDIANVPLIPNAAIGGAAADQERRTSAVAATARDTPAAERMTQTGDSEAWQKTVNEAQRKALKSTDNSPEGGNVEVQGAAVQKDLGGRSPRGEAEQQRRERIKPIEDSRRANEASREPTPGRTGTIHVALTSPSHNEANARTGLGGIRRVVSNGRVIIGTIVVVTLLVCAYLSLHLSRLDLKTFWTSKTAPVPAKALASSQAKPSVPSPTPVHSLQLKQKYILKGHKDIVHSLVFSPDGHTLASAGRESRIILWDVANGQQLRILQNRTEWVTALAFSPDGHTLASGGSGSGPLNNIKLWDVETGSIRRTLSQLMVGSIGFSPDGRFLAWDGVLLLRTGYDGESLSRICA